MLTRIVSNDPFGKRLVARVMTIFGIHVGLHIPNNGYSEVYGCIGRYLKVYGGIWGKGI